MLTLAGEAIELPIATDHNKHIDYTDLAIELGVRKYFTPVIGNEVTTQLEENLINDVDKTEAEMYQEVLEAGLQEGQTLESLEKIELMVDS